MRINRIRIQGYRSLFDVQFAPGLFTVLAGPNNAGKSNLVDALDFLADAYRNGLKKSVDKRGGIASIGFRREHQSESKLAFDVEAIIPTTDAIDWWLEPEGHLLGLPPFETGNVNELAVQHRFGLVSSKRGAVAGYTVARDELDIVLMADNAHQATLRFSRENGTLQYSAPASGGVPDMLWSILFPRRPGETRLMAPSDMTTSLLGTAIPRTELMLDRIRILSPVADLFAGQVEYIQLYRLVAASCRLSGPPAAMAELGVDGSNLPSHLYYLREQRSSAWASVLQAMTQVVPNLEDIKIEPDYDGRLTLRFFESGIKRPWSATEMSDGTIRALGLFAALYDPRRPFLIIEEPENSVHPWMVRVFIDACREVTSAEHGKQVVLTTHSPVVLNHISPEDVCLVWREQGQTSVAPLLERDPQAADLWASGESTVFGLLDSGWLRESVPEGV